MAQPWAVQGCAVELVSKTNGDIGRWREAGGPLALRRKAEIERVAHILGVTSEVLDTFQRLAPFQPDIAVGIDSVLPRMR